MIEISNQRLNRPSSRLTVDQLVGQPISILVRADRQGEINKILKETLHSGIPSTFRTEHEAPNGETFHYESEAVQWKNKDEIIGIILTARDITTRATIEEALKKSESDLVDAQRIAKIGNFTWDVGTGAVTWSDSLFEMLQYDKTEKINLSKVNAKIHHPDDLERVTQWLEKCVASKKNILTPNEYRIVRKDGEVIHVQTVGAIHRRRGKQPVVFATVQDISKRKEKEVALRESEKRYRTLFQNMTAGFVLFEVVKNDKGVPVDLVIIAANKGFENTTGLKMQDVTGKRLTSVLPVYKMMPQTG